MSSPRRALSQAGLLLLALLGTLPALAVASPGAAGLPYPIVGSAYPSAYPISGWAQRSADPTADPTSKPAGLRDPREKNIAMQIVSSNENSTLDWRAQYEYIEDIHDGRGYTAGIIGFCSGTGDMLRLVETYTRREPDNPLARFLPALRRVNGSPSHQGLGVPFVRAWKRAATDLVFRHAQNAVRDRIYFNPVVARAVDDGLGTLGQFIYYDAIVMHGPGAGVHSFGGIRRTALQHARTPAQGGDQTTYLDAFLDVRRSVMKHQRKHHNTSRIDTEQRVFLRAGNLRLRPPMVWHVYGDRFEIPDR